MLSGIGQVLGVLGLAGSLLATVVGVFVAIRKGGLEKRTAAMDIADKATELAGVWMERAQADVAQARTDAAAARAAAEKAQAAAEVAESRAIRAERIADRFRAWAHRIIADWSTLRLSETPPGLPADD